MCGEVPKGHYKTDVVVHLQNNQTTVKIPITRKLEWVKEVWLTEFQITNPGNIGVYRVDLGDMLRQQEVGNITGKGFTFVVDSTVITHTVFERPRMVTSDKRGQILELDVTVQDVTTGNVVVPTFDTATFFLTFVMRDPNWSPELEQFIDRNLPQNAAGQFSTRAPFF